MKYEYKTTYGDASKLIHYSEDMYNTRIGPDDPKPPFDEDGWELVSMAATESILYWSWRKLIKE